VSSEFGFCDIVILMFHGVSLTALYITLYSNFVIFNYDSQVSRVLTNRWAKFVVVHFYLTK